MHLNRSLYLLGFLSLLVDLTNVYSQQPTKTLAVEILPKGVLGTLVADVDLGVIPAGIGQAFEIALTNTGDVDLEIVEVKTSCNCSNAKLSNMRIGAGQVSLLYLEQNAGTSLADLGKGKSVITLRGSNSEVRVVSSYTVGNLAGFTSRFTIVEYRKGAAAKEIKIPVVITYPHQPKDFTLRCSEDFSSSCFQLSSDAEGANFVAVDLSQEDIPVSGVTATLYLEKDGELFDKLTMSISEPKPYSFAGSSVFLRQSDGGDSLSGNAIFRINNWGEETKGIDKLLVDGNVDGNIPLAVQSRNIGNGVYRIEIVVSPETRKSILERIDQSTKQKGGTRVSGKPKVDAQLRFRFGSFDVVETARLVGI